ncbi:hypothetical protein TCAL_14673 [Tigriopus californicus]|uniref:Uncharacterized protein n=1 Tax=Tigriopus californicus TaxID=6832 RepID=A0A553NPJ3_TIGCA|nr:hypothetical protein TCAL_14673 [Tigriopus californicus]
MTAQFSPMRTRRRTQTCLQPPPPRDTMTPPWSSPTMTSCGRQPIGGAHRHPNIHQTRSKIQRRYSSPVLFPVQVPSKPPAVASPDLNRGRRSRPAEPVFH